MRRREFLGFVGAAAAVPFDAHAQRTEQVRRIGVLMGVAETDSVAPQRIDALKKQLADRGWVDGRNVMLEVIWAASDPDRTQRGAEALVSHHPDVLVAQTLLPAMRLKKLTSDIPIVFTNVSDPNGAGLVEKVTKPGSNITGFSNLEPTIGAKWLELIMEVAPKTRKVVVIFNPKASPVAEPFARSAQGAAERFHVEVVAAPVLTVEEIAPVMTALAQRGNGGLIFPPDIFSATHRKWILELAARHRLPAVYPYRFFVDDGGLMSYGTNAIDSFAQAAIYVDRIFKGAKPAELPVQAPVKFEFVISTKVAKALGLEVPSKLLFTADDVIE